MLEMGRMVAESVMLIERELAGSDYHPSHPDLRKWGHEEDSTYIID